MRVVLTREAGLNDAARAWFSDEDQVDEVALSETVSVTDEEFAAAVARLGSRRFRALVVTSARAAARAAPLAARCDRVLSVGSATSGALGQRGVAVSAEAPGAEALAGLITEGPVLAVGAREPRRELDEALARAGIELVRLVAYETTLRCLGQSDRDRLAAADVVLVGAPSAWRAAREHVRASAWVVVPGPTTAAAVRADHERVLIAWGPELAARRDQLAGGRAQGA